MQKRTWSTTEDEKLARLFKDNSIDWTEEGSNDYLWEKTQEFFPEFTGKGASGKANAIRRLRDKCRKWDLERSLKGARRRSAATGK